MKRFEMRVDPLTHEIYYAVPLTGSALLQDPLLNKGHAFNRAERAEFNLTGLMPDAVGTLEEQVVRSLGNYKVKTTDLGRYVTLMSLLDRNETLFYTVITQHIQQMLPIVYTPTVGQACMEMSHIIRRYRGIYVSPTTVNIIEKILENTGLPNISLMVATDGERILGLGDLGADGMGIPVGKIALYVAAAGIHPASTLPICIDVGTNNERLLNDPLYIGVRHPRLTGQEYDDIIERFVQGVRRVFPKALLQWEDFGRQHAFPLLDRYKDRILSFNDDIQGTGATAAAALCTAAAIRNRSLGDDRIAIYGFGQAGSGVANAIVTMMHEQGGLSIEEARRRIYPIDINGLLVEGMKAEDYQANFLQPKAAIADWPVSKDRSPSLAEVVKHGKITVVIGLSTQAGAFDEALLKTMAGNTDRPIILALSNPTNRSETTPEAAMRATGGRALVATGSPYAPFAGPDGRMMETSQCNNLYMFPGMGLGAIVCQATRITHRMFHAASCAVSNMVTAEQRAKGMLLPELNDIRKVSFTVALAVAKQAREDGFGMIASDDHLAELIHQAMWTPRYYPYRQAKLD